MEKNLEHTFKDLINASKAEKTIEYYCPCCGVTFKTQRRDMTYVLATFLVALRDMGEDSYHPYREVIQYAIRKYNCTPSDYSILHRWLLIESKAGKGNLKYKRLTQAGKDFLDCKLDVASHHYQLPYSEKIMHSKTKVSFIGLQNQWLEKKEDKKPFLDLTKIIYNGKEKTTYRIYLMD